MSCTVFACFFRPIVFPFLKIFALLSNQNNNFVAKFKIQAVVATLILMTAGRGIAQLLTEGQIVTVYYKL